jgi:DNA-binding IclR family transcriptional regulator
MPYMEDLYEATHENVQLAVREGVEVVWVERIAGRTAVPVLTRVGGRFPLPATGGGLVLLAYAPQEVLDEVLSRPLERFTERTIVQQRALRSALAEVRRTGLAVSDRQVTMDALSVAAPVRGQGEQVVAALSLVVAAEGARPQAIAPAVLAAARAISRSLGSQQASASPAGENLRAPAYPAEPGFTGWAGRAGDTVRG